ncbi:hypothetical protein F0562_032476 [Nyssa sinensis]|uniref:CCHC-type domain-containing protein n=1 Tax=Nyssa sinensis TaxID=561372 RepID=A0A5J5AN55_9ASTE|nr:hypothetical protein F0562_032476 [Nyssa sinensis]
MSKALSAKNKLGFVNGTLTKPTNRSNPLYSAWERCNDMVLSWILNSVTKNIASSILYIDVAADVWKDLKERFSQGNRPRIFQLKKALNSLTQDQMTVSDYFTQLKSYWDELANYRQLPQCKCGVVKNILEFQQEEYILQFLMGLNESFTAIKGQILLLDPLPSMNRVFALIVQDEKQREIKVNSVPSFDSIAAVTTTTMNSSVTNKNGNKQSGFRRDRPVCSHCGYTGHISDKCYRIHSFPPGFKSKKANVHSANQVTSSPVDQVSNEFPQLAFTEEQQSANSCLNQPSHQIFLIQQIKCQLLLLCPVYLLVDPNVSHPICTCFNELYYRTLQLTRNQDDAASNKKQLLKQMDISNQLLCLFSISF